MQPLVQEATPSRARHVRPGMQIELISILWMTIEASVVPRSSLARTSGINGIQTGMSKLSNQVLVKRSCPSQVISS